MNWALLLPIIIREGIPTAMRLWQLLKEDSPVTQEDWDALIVLSQKTYDDYIAEAQARAALLNPPPPE